MKEATGETSMVVITIVIVALLVAIGSAVFKEGGVVQKWIENTFEEKTGAVNK